mmetsp:Transcript_4464/g.10102  ORF Transcript_4464/g.10102 Transcript_4464/m.10102 type:complete len:262 (+) Transcript_4464:974-1759(+)
MALRYRIECCIVHIAEYPIGLPRSIVRKQQEGEAEFIRIVAGHKGSGSRSRCNRCRRRCGGLGRQWNKGGLAKGPIRLVVDAHLDVVGSTRWVQDDFAEFKDDDLVPIGEVVGGVGIIQSRQEDRVTIPALVFLDNDNLVWFLLRSGRDTLLAIEGKVDIVCELEQDVLSTVDRIHMCHVTQGGNLSIPGQLVRQQVIIRTRIPTQLPTFSRIETLEWTLRVYIGGSCSHHTRSVSIDIFALGGMTQIEIVSNLVNRKGRK